MPYSPEENNNLIDSRVERINKEIAICQEVQNTIDSNGWKKTIGPLIDRMIIDTVGGKIGDSWVSGKLDRAKKDEKREFYIGYKQSLIDLHSRLMFHISQLQVLKDQLIMLKKDKEERYKVPLVDDTRYRSEG